MPALANIQAAAIAKMGSIMTVQEYANSIQSELHDGQSLNEEFLTLVKWITRIQIESFRQGMERSVQIIKPQNPHARSPDTETRNRCCGEIGREIH